MSQTDLGLVNFALYLVVVSVHVVHTLYVFWIGSFIGLFIKYIIYLNTFYIFG